MESRVNKYNVDDNETLTRTKKNARLYNEISEIEKESFDINSNKYILSSNSKTIDIEKLKDMLDKQYREETTKKSLANVDDISASKKISLDETRDYDINALINKAKEDKKETYEEERYKKLRNTQVDILNDLNIEALEKKEEANISVSKAEGLKLKSLIDTINLTEETNAIKNLDPLDLLSDLKGDDDETRVNGVEEFNEEIKKASDLNTNKLEQIHNEIKQDINSSTLKLDNLTKELKGVMDEKKEDNSFYTTSSIITKNDYDDFSDLKDDISATKVVIKILIVIVILAFICGIVFLLNQILDWGLF